MSIVTGMSVLGQGVSDIQYAKTKIIATYLAQEGIEIARNKRDSLMIENKWADFNASSFTLPPVESGFTREVTVSGSGNEKTIVSTVTWTQGSRPHSVEFSEVLFNWIEQ